MGSPPFTEPKAIDSSKEESMHVLEFKWDHNNDTQVVSRGTNSTIRKSLTTQRLVLSLVSEVYDPIGLVAAPFTVGALLILELIWRVNGQRCDDDLPKNTVHGFLACCVELTQIAKITIPRTSFLEYFEHLEHYTLGGSPKRIQSYVSLGLK